MTTEIKASAYRLQARRDNTSRIAFRDDKGRTVEVALSNANVMHLAHALRQLAREAPLLMAKRATRFHTLSSSPIPDHPADSAGPTTPGMLQFGTGTSADLDRVYMWFHLPAERADQPRPLFETFLDLDAAETLMRDLGRAIALARSKPPEDTPTQH